MSEEQQQQALVLYAQGNQLFDDSLFKAAVDKYQKALGHWNHPGIHYNLMLALVALNQSIEAYQSCIQALRYGPIALEPKEYRRAQDYQKLLRARIADLTLACDESGAVVSLDGKKILACPGNVQLFVLPGQHELVARKRGYLATHHTLAMHSEKPASVHIRMLPSSQALITTRRLKAWQPWTVVSAGLGVALVGGALEWRSGVNSREFQTLFNEVCPAPKGCEESEYTKAMESRQLRYRWYHRLGQGAFVTGGVATVTGLALVYLNRSQQIENPERQRLVRVSMTPLVAPGMGGLVANLSF